MKNYIIVFLMFVLSQPASAFHRYGERYCHDSEFSCITIKRGDSWTQLFPDPVQRDIVKRVNRLNVFLQPDMVIAVPNNLSQLTTLDLSPFPQTIQSDGEKSVRVDLSQFAWAAYNETGQLIKWGPVSPGTEQCLDVPSGCSTPKGSFRVVRKQGADCVSNSFPHRINGVRGGAEMPYCVFFYRGYALHGSHDLPGYEASYGCLRLFIEDAQWLNEQFVELPSVGVKGTKIVITD
jgi:hypothetical protein